jgi:glycosyltransferase involved in cell wall biosynthesis
MKKAFDILYYIETSGPGGAETVLVDTVSNLDQERFEPHVVLHKSKWLHEQLKRHNIPTTIIPGNKSMDIPFLYQLIRKGKQVGCKLIHAHLYGAGFYSCLAGKLLRVPVVITLHNEPVLPGSTERFADQKNYVIKNFAKKIVLVAQYLIPDYIQKARFPESKLTVIYNGINAIIPPPQEELKKLKKDLGLCDDDIIIGNVANFRVPKGHNYLIQAAKIVCDNYPQAKFLLIGETDRAGLKQSIIDQINEAELSNNFKILGFREDVSKLLHIFDIFMLASISEGLPLSVIEAMFAARPIVVTDVGGLGEMIDDGKSGFLVEPRNPRVLAEKITVLIEQQKLRQELGKMARVAAKQKFSIDKMMKRYQDLYSECLGL